VNKHTMSFIMNNRGASLIEATIGVSVMLLALMSYNMSYVNIKANNAKSKMMVERSEYANDLISDLSVSSKCSNIISRALNDGATPLVALEPVPKTANKKLMGDNLRPFTERFTENKVNLESVGIEFELATTPDPTQSSDSKTYHGSLTYNFIDASTDGQKVPLKPVTVQFTIFDELDAKLWSRANCTTRSTELSTEIGETCALWGGVFVDGAHCDFHRQFRVHQTASDAAIKPHDLNETNVKRHTLADVLCYVDTLIAMVPDQHLATAGERDFSKDSYKREYRTRFCRKPARVAEALRVDFASVVDGASEDIMPLLTDIGQFQGKCNFVLPVWALGQAYYSWRWASQCIKEFKCVDTCSLASNYVIMPGHPGNSRRLPEPPPDARYLCQQVFDPSVNRLVPNTYDSSNLSRAIGKRWCFRQ
jgi:hypothetical protein